MKNIKLERKTAIFINTILNYELDRNRTKLKEMKEDKKCTIEMYEKTLDKCKELENAIKQMEKFTQ